MKGYTETHQAYQHFISRVKVLNDSKNNHFRNSYVSLSGLLNTIQPVLAEEGFLLRESTVIEHCENGPHTMRDTLTKEDSSEESEVSYNAYINHRLSLYHEGTLVDSSEYFVCYCGQSPQSQGSCLTYARRYHILSFLGLAGEDDDGNTAQELTKVAMKRKIK